MKVLFIHQNFPGQFVHLAGALARDRKNRVVALAQADNPVPPGVELRTYSLLRAPAEQTHPLLQEEEGKVLRAEAVAAAAFHLKQEGFAPDIVVAHPGWGEAMFIKDVFPAAKLLVYCEYYYAAEGQDVGFDPEQPALSFQQRCNLRMRNCASLLALQDADAAISPTQWQRSTFPAWAHNKINVIHDGIDYGAVAYNPHACLSLATPAGQLRLTNKDKVFSYVARSLEPVRGFHMFMRMLPKVLKHASDAHVVVVGGHDVSYGSLAPGGGSWLDYLLDEVGSELDLRRVHFVGRVPKSAFHNLLNVSRAHLYWSMPFVLSWSLLEAAASGVPLIASDTPPIQEFAADLGITTHPFFDTDAFASSLLHRLSCTDPQRSSGPLLESIELQRCLAQQVKLLNEL